MDQVVPEGDGGIDIPVQAAEMEVEAPGAAPAADDAPSVQHRGRSRGRRRRRSRRTLLHSRRGRGRGARGGRGRGRGSSRGARSESPIDPFPIDPFIPTTDSIPNPLADHEAMVRAVIEFAAVRESTNPHGDGPSPLPSEDED